MSNGEQICVRLPRAVKRYLEQKVKNGEFNSIEDAIMYIVTDWVRTQQLIEKEEEMGRNSVMSM